jgi:plasmid stabilization system protein ParE
VPISSTAARSWTLTIDDYTIEHFGLRQAAKLREQFRETFQTLLHSPSMAPLRRDYDPPGKIFRYFPALKKFVIVYEPVKAGIRVARVLHGARDLAAELERDSGSE